jgi:hypothetical protein
VSLIGVLREKTPNQVIYPQQFRKDQKRKDLLQAQQLIELLMEDDPDALRSAYKDLKGRWLKWNTYFKDGIRAFLNLKIRQSFTKTYAIDL